MLKIRRNRPADSGEAGSGQTPADAAGAAADDTGAGNRLMRLAISPFSIGTQVAALVVIGVLMIAGLSLIGEARLASIAADIQAQRHTLDTDRTDVTVALAAAQRAETTSTGYLDAFGRAGDNVVSGRSSSAAADLAEKSLTDFAQSLQPLDGAVRAFAVAAAKSVYLRPWDETVENAQEAAFIKTNRDRIAAILKITQEMPTALGGVVLDNQEMTAALRSGNVADARELYLSRQAPKIAAVDQLLKSLRASLVDFNSDLANRHASLSRATDNEAEDRYSGQRASIRLQIVLLMLVLCAGGALIAIYGLAIPLADLTNAAARFAEGHFEEPTTVLGRRDEIGRLSRALERIRESVSTVKQTSDQQGREEREQKEADRLARVTLERENQQLRRDRERLEKELAEREQAAAPSAEPQISPEALEQERAKLRAELQAEAERRLAEASAALQKELDAAKAEAARLKAELDKKPAAAPASAPDPALREALTKAETDVARLKIETERQKAAAAAQAKTHQEALATAQAEIARLTGEVQKLKDAPPSATADPALQDRLKQAEAAVTSLKEQIARQRVGAQAAARDAAEEAEKRIAKVTADAQQEREQLVRAAQEAMAAAAAAEQDRVRLAGELALEKQMREEELAQARASHARETAELERRLTEQLSDRLQVLNELTNTFEASVATTVAAVQTASRDVTLASGRIGDAVQHAGISRDEVATRVGRATQSIQSAAAAAEQIAAAFDELAEQMATSAQAAGGATVSTRSAIDAVQALENAASRITEVGTVITDIAERTNVLSLNASIEAAKAGEAGKGFVVVAAEIKSLANRAGRTGKEISDRIKAVAAATGTVRSAVAGVDRAVGEIEGLVGKTSRGAAHQGLSARSIATGIHTAVDGAESLSRTIGETLGSVDTSARIVAQAQSSVEILSAQAQELRRQIDEFLAAIRAV